MCVPVLLAAWQPGSRLLRLVLVLVTLRLYLADGREQLFSQEVDSNDETPLEILGRVSKHGRIPLGDRESCSLDSIIDAKLEPSPEPQTGPDWTQAGAPVRDEDVAAALSENYEPRQ
jgi:hypothetical protein